MKDLLFFAWIVCAMFTWGSMEPLGSGDELVGAAIVSGAAWPAVWGLRYSKELGRN